MNNHLRNIFALGWVCFFIFAILSCSTAPQDENLIVITHAVIIDGNGGQPIEDGYVVIQDGIIKSVGTSETMILPQKAQTIDAQGKTVMPGLADMHVHLVGGWDGEATDILGYQRYLNSLLYAGVTTVLDMGNMLPFSVQMRQEINAGRIPGPRIYTSGPLIDGPNPFWPDISFTVASVEQIPLIVKKLKAQGVDFLKAYAGLTQEQVVALVKEGEKEDLRVFIHRPRRIPYADLAETGVASTAHMPSGPISDEVVTKMKQNKVACITTLSVIEVGGLQRFHNKIFLEHPLILDTTPPWFMEKIAAIEPKATRPSKGLQTAFTNAKRYFDAGVLLVAGTDAPYPGVFQGEGIHRELELLVEAGLKPLQAITLATKNASILMQAEAEWGTISPGKIADLIIIEGRPDKNIGETRNITHVIQNGKILNREALKFDINKDPGFRISTSVAK